jgi:hypothetical protein
MKKIAYFYLKNRAGILRRCWLMAPFGPPFGPPLGSPFAPLGAIFAPLGPGGVEDITGAALAIGLAFIFGPGGGAIDIEGGQAQVAAELGGEIPVPFWAASAGGGIGGIGGVFGIGAPRKR